MSEKEAMPKTVMNQRKRSQDDGMRDVNSPPSKKLRGTFSWGVARPPAGNARLLHVRQAAPVHVSFLPLELGEADQSGHQHGREREDDPKGCQARQ